MHSPPLQSWFSDPMTDAKVPFTMSNTHTPQGKVASPRAQTAHGMGPASFGSLAEFFKKTHAGQGAEKGVPSLAEGHGDFC